jgi:hypothetical protein
MITGIHNLHKQSAKRSIYYYIYNIGLRSLVLKLFHLFESRKNNSSRPIISLEEILSQNITRGYVDGGRLKLA